MAEGAAGPAGGAAGAAAVGGAGGDDGGEHGGGAGGEAPARAPPRITMDVAIATLKTERERLAQDRKRVRKDLKNALKKRSRLRKKASSLSNEDLFDIMRLRDLPGAQGPGAGANAAAGGANANGHAEPAAGALFFTVFAFLLLFPLSYKSSRDDNSTWEPSAPPILSGLLGHGSGVPLAFSFLFS